MRWWTGSLILAVATAAAGAEDVAPGPNRYATDPFTRPLEPVTFTRTNDVRNSAGHTPIVMTRSFARDHDLDIPLGGADHAHGYVGRLTTVPRADNENCTITLEKDGDEVYAAFRVDRSATGMMEASVHHRPALIEQFRKDPGGGTSNLTTIYIWADLALQLPNGVFGPVRHLEVLAPSRSDGAEVVPLSIWNVDGVNHWFLREAGPFQTDVRGLVPVPPDGTRFQLRASWVAPVTGGDGIFEMTQSVDGGKTWALVFKEDRLTGPDSANRMWFGVHRRGPAYEGDFDPELRLYEYGFAATHGYHDSESSANRHLLLPSMANMSDDDLFALITHDPLWGVMTLDVTQTQARVRLQLEPNERTASWTDLYGYVRYSTVPNGHVVGVSPVTHLAKNARAGYVSVVGLDGLAPGTAYYYEPVFQDAANAPEHVYDPRTTFSFRTKPSALGSRQRYVFLSCAKGWGAHLPHPVLHLAAHPEQTGLPDDELPLAIMLFDDINYPDDPSFGRSANVYSTEGGPAFTVADYDRIYRQWLESPLHRDAKRTIPFQVTYGDHLVHNNWWRAWWGNQHAIDSNENDNPFTTPAPHGPSYRHAGMTRGKLVDNAMDWFARSFWDGFLGRQPGRGEWTYTNGANPGHVLPQWRSWKSGNLHFIQIDTRSFLGDPAASVSNLLGDDQHAWLEQQLGDPEGSLKVIISPSPVSNFVANGDNWEGFPAARRAMLTAIRDRLPAGHQCLIIGGDRHCPQILTKVRNGRLEGVDLSDKVVADLVACPVASRFPHAWQSDPTVMDTDDDVVWCLRGSTHQSVRENNRTDGRVLGTAEMVRTLMVVDFDEAGAELDVYVLDGFTGAIMDDGKGQPGMATFAAPALRGETAASPLDRLVELLGAWGTATSPVDFDASGRVDSEDLLILLQAWDQRVPR